jgi:hypothetical protein
MKTLRLSIGTALANTAPLDQASALNRVSLFKNAVTPNENNVIGDLTLADFDGSTAKTVALGAQEAAVDPVSGQQVITVPEVVGGWRWETSGVTNLPQTIYGFALYDSTGPGPLLGIELLPTPITLTEVGQEINIGKVCFRVALEPLE